MNLADERRFDVNRKMLRLLQETSGRDKRPVRENSLFIKAATDIDQKIEPEETRRTLDALAGEGYAAHDYDILRGVVWRITEDGLNAVRSMEGAS